MRSTCRAAHRQVRQEEGLIRIAASIFLALLLVGCRVPPAKVDKTAKAAEPPPRRGTVEVGTAEFTQYAPEPHRRKVWTVKWDSAEIDVVEGLRPGGKLHNVNATIYEVDRSETTLHSDTAETAKKSTVLILKGNVTANSIHRDAHLTCDALKWDPDLHVVIATGNVRYHSVSMEAGPFPEIWATPDMERLGTPDTFAKEGVKEK